jgi:antitoxin (DNA-binding transcriptional repressor) of toxin-antitoxin stability system
MYHKEVGSFEAKTHFSQLLAEVMEGNEIIITRHGKRVAVLRAFKEIVTASPVQNAINAIESLRKNITLNAVDKVEKLSIQSMISEGRR